MIRLGLITQSRNLVNRSVESELLPGTIKERLVRVDAV
jgi:hypothetical protein